MPGEEQLEQVLAVVGDVLERDVGGRVPGAIGEAVERDPVPQPTAEHLFGYGAHHAVRARISVERGRPWQAEYWISALRDHGLMLAARRRGSR